MKWEGLYEQMTDAQFDAVQVGDRVVLCEIGHGMGARDFGIAVVERRTDHQIVVRRTRWSSAPEVAVRRMGRAAWIGLVTPEIEANEAQATKLARVRTFLGRASSSIGTTFGRNARDPMPVEVLELLAQAGGARERRAAGAARRAGGGMIAAEDPALPALQVPGPMCAGPAVPVLDPGIRVSRELLREIGALLEMVEEGGTRREARLSAVFASLASLLFIPGDTTNPGGDGTAGGVPWRDPRGEE